VIELAASAAHVFVDSLDEHGGLALDEGDLHHMARVLRLRVGEAVSASDGRGGWRWCRWVGAGLEPDGPVVRSTRPAPPIGVAFALLKGDRLDWVVQKLTEIGVDSIVPITTLRCVVRWDATRSAAALARLERVARAAAMQSRRVWLPEIEPVRALAEVAARPDAALADAGGTWMPAGLEATLIVVGPEGGWDEVERAAFQRCYRLSEQVLRAETAAICAATLLQDRRRSLDSKALSHHVE
jgi:16S rRNA (uracil1498-N3)-methyltransferase